MGTPLSGLQRLARERQDYPCFTHVRCNYLDTSSDASAIRSAEMHVGERNAADTGRPKDPRFNPGSLVCSDRKELSRSPTKTETSQLADCASRRGGDARGFA